MKTTFYIRGQPIGIVAVGLALLASMGASARYPAATADRLTSVGPQEEPSSAMSASERPSHDCAVG